MSLTAIFSPIGWLGIVLAVAGLMLCLLYYLRPLRLVPWAAMAAFACSFLFAHIHSTRHVARIQIERDASAAAEEEPFSYAKLLEARGEDVAPVRFAEDSRSDLIDRAGLSEADLAYFDSVAEKPPASVKQAEESSGETGPEPIVVSEAGFALAHRIDRWNLNLTQILLALAAFLVGYDYLRRFNQPAAPSFPLPLPSAIPNAVSPLPALVVAGPKQQDLTRQLRRLARRGDAFLCLTDATEAASAAFDSLTAAAKWPRPKSLLRINEENPAISDAFIFESLWYGRASFIIDQADRVPQLIDSTLAALAKRKAARARVRQSAHIVWNLSEPPTESQQNQLTTLAQATGFSIMIL